MSKLLTSVDQYLKAQPESSREALDRVRAAICKALPDAEETIAYSMPAYKLRGSAIVYFAGWKKHFSLYPISKGVKAALGSALDAYDVEKGTIRFPLSEPVPTDIVERIARLRADEELGGVTSA